VEIILFKPTFFKTNRTFLRVWNLNCSRVITHFFLCTNLDNLYVILFCDYSTSTPKFELYSWYRHRLIVRYNRIFLARHALSKYIPSSFVSFSLHRLSSVTLCERHVVIFVQILLCILFYFICITNQKFTFLSLLLVGKKFTLYDKM